ncbi:MAG: hypothetical protein K2X48_19995 [Chitinophagaceae bacterium]|nr:hypothetical protein [Chitinophagaceae bacterium]
MGIILCIIMPQALLSQAKDSTLVLPLRPPPGIVSSNTQATSSNPAQYKPEIFTSGFIDIINNGQINASSRFIRLFIGEPGKLAVPLSIYSGVSSNNFQNSQTAAQRNNDMLFTNFINPLSGLVNLSIDGVLFFNRKKEKTTKAGMLYHFGERVLTGVRTGPVSDPNTGKPVNFFNSFVSMGLYFQTGAWEKNNARNLGVSWVAIRYIGCYSNPVQLKSFLPAIETNGIYLGYSLAWGVEITKLVNIKAVYYKYNKRPEIDYFLPIYQFSFNYAFKN